MTNTVNGSGAGPTPRAGIGPKLSWRAASRRDTFGGGFHRQPESVLPPGKAGDLVLRVSVPGLHHRFQMGFAELPRPWRHRGCDEAVVGNELELVSLKSYIAASKTAGSSSSS